MERARAAKAAFVRRWRGSNFSKRVLLVALGIAVLGGCLAPTVQTLLLMVGGFGLLSLVLFLSARIGKLPGRTVRVRRGLVVLVITMWLGLILAEMVLRVVFFPLFPDLEKLGHWGYGLQYQYDRTVGWVPIPNSRALFTHKRTISIAHNSRGFRDPEPTWDSRPAVVFIGDSFVWGYNVEASERFTERLRARHPERRIYNFGVCGYSTDQEYLLLQRHFKEYQPRLVFLIFCTDNDDEGNRSNVCSDWYYKPYFVPRPNGLELRGVPVPISERVFYLDHPILSKPYLVRLTLRAWRNLVHPHPHWQTSPTPAILEALRHYVEARGATFCVGLTERDPRLESFLQGAKIPFVDLSTNLRVPGDSHWSPEGHAFVAGKIDEFLSARNWK